VAERGAVMADCGNSDSPRHCEKRAGITHKFIDMNEIAGRIIAHYERHARDWDADRNAGVESWKILLF
jgi:hypothetical protein